MLTNISEANKEKKKWKYCDHHAGLDYNKQWVGFSEMTASKP